MRRVGHRLAREMESRVSLKGEEAFGCSREATIMEEAGDERSIKLVGYGVDQALSHHQSLCPSTPVPSWKLYQNPFYDGQNCHRPHAPAANSRRQQHYRPVVSARKLLAASFWEHPQIPLYNKHDVALPQEEYFQSLPAEGQPHAAPLSAPYDSQALKCGSDCKFLQMDALKQAAVDLSETVNREAEEAGMTSPTSLTHILGRVRSVEETQSTSLSEVAALRMELEDACARLQELEFSHKSARSEIDGLLKRFGEEMTMSRRRDHDKINAAFHDLREEIEEEKNASRRLKILNKKLAKDLSEANRAAAAAFHELERERKARVLMEDVCNELAREIGEDKAEVEELKRDQAKIREKVEEERKMLRMAALWHEERVRTQLSETQLELEGKNVALGDLKSKLDAFLKTVRDCSSEVERDPEHLAQIQQAQMLRQALEFLQLHDQVEGTPKHATVVDDENEVPEDHDSDDRKRSDLDADENRQEDDDGKAGRQWMKPRYNKSSEEKSQATNVSSMENGSQVEAESQEEGSEWEYEDHEASEWDDVSVENRDRKANMGRRWQRVREVEKHELEDGAIKDFNGMQMGSNIMVRQDASEARKRAPEPEKKRLLVDNMSSLKALSTSHQHGSWWDASKVLFPRRLKGSPDQQQQHQQPIKGAKKKSNSLHAQLLEARSVDNENSGSTLPHGFKYSPLPKPA